MPAPGESVLLTIEKPAAGGRMIARLNGQIVLVGGAIPGERVTARVERVGKGVVYADTVGIDTASPDRRAAAADPLCGGCLYAHRLRPRLEIRHRSSPMRSTHGRLIPPAAVRVAIA
jgi:23S rRNA (uracil1939-C5)-methyltransferase